MLTENKMLTNQTINTLDNVQKQKTTSEQKLNFNSAFRQSFTCIKQKQTKSVK